MLVGERPKERFSGDLMLLGSGVGMLCEASNGVGVGAERGART